METSAIGSASSSDVLGGSKTAQALGGDDFFKLLIAQLSNQDPMEPMSNQELLNQISSIRDIELSTSLAETLKQLTSENRFGSAASLIGRYVTGQPSADNPAGQGMEGVVVGVRFGDDGRPLLKLDNGNEVPIDSVASVVTSEQAAQTLIGRMVTGVTLEDPNAPAIIEGMVTGTRTADDGSVLLELDTGETIPLSSVISTVSSDGATGGTSDENAGS